MKTLIISSSLSENSKSFILCKQTQKRLEKQGVEVTLVDAREYEINPFYRFTGDIQKIKDEVQKADNIIIGMGVHCYSINDNLKVILDNCFEFAKGKFFGILCAAGGEKSYLSTMHLTQICMNEWRMIQLPRIVYTVSGQDFDKETQKITSEDLIERLDKFSEEFIKIGNKLLN